MDHPLDTVFVQLLNQNLGIAHKVSRVYFPDADEREEVLQEMMYQLWKSYPRFDGRSKFSTWMYSVCLNTALTYRRRLRKEKMERLSPTHYGVADQSSTTEEESMAMLFKAISELTPLNKAIVLLHLEDMSYEEIATVTGLSRSNVSVRLVRIKKELETWIKQNQEAT